MLEIMSKAHFFVREEESFDNWNGGTYGHHVLVFVPPETMRKIAFSNQGQIENSLLSDLSTCASNVSNERFEQVELGLIDEFDTDFQKSFQLSQQPHTNPDMLHIWKAGHLRLFISHRDSHKAQARRIGDALNAYGISAFIAHDTIQPMSIWQKEIEKGLETMEVMLAFITDGFHESIWTNQEIGYALGKGIPIIPVKYGREDPNGFIGEKQAIRGDLKEAQETAIAVYRILVEKLGQRERIQQTLISAFLAAPNYDEARDRFDRMQEAVETLSAREIEQITNGFAENNQLNSSIYLTNRANRLLHFLRDTTGKTFAIDGNQLKVIKR